MAWEDTRYEVLVELQLKNTIVLKRESQARAIIEADNEIEEKTT